jgi:ABC-type amino acid transport substrate-binding protein
MSSRWVWSLAAALAGFAMATGASAQQDDLLKQIKGRGVLRVCEAAYPPYNVKNPKTETWEGINVEIIDELAKGLNVKVEHVDGTFATLIASLNTKKCDLSAAATYVTPPRAEQALFSRAFAADTKTLFVRQDSKAKTYAEVDKPDVTISVRAGTAEERFAKGFFKNAKIQVVTSDKTVAHLLEVANGRADAAMSAYSGNMLFIKENPNLKLRPIGDKLLDPSPFAFMLPKGEYHFQQFLNVFLATYEDQGKLKAVFDKWLLPQN